MRATRRALFLPFALGACGTYRGPAGPAPEYNPANARAALVRSIDSMVAAPEFRNANWGILIVDPLAADTLYSHNAQRLFIPASNQKLVTSSVLLEQLGPDYRFHTEVAARGAVAEQTLNGDLAIVGRGDPTTSDHMKGDAMLPLREIADSVWDRGVRRITGRVVALGNAFPGPVAGSGWPWDGLDGASFAGADELLFNEGLAAIHIRAGARVGDAATIETKPARTYPAIRNLVTTVADNSIVVPAGRGGRGAGRRVRWYHDTTTSAIVVHGEIALGDSATITITQHDPDAAYVAALTEALRDRGIVVDEHDVANAATSADSLFTMMSVPLSEILPAILKPSQNQIAEVFLRTLGLEGTGVGTADSGRRVVERQFAEWKIQSDGFVVRDGSGLSRNDLISPQAVVGILDAMRRSPNYSLFYESLPIAGVDGTIRTRMKGTPAEGNVHAKTGSLSMVRSLSGYVHTADGRLLEFSTLCNNWTVTQATVDRVADAIAVSLARLRLR
jgi:serine-type D-Ala-D-Ala carboxypeptidase/endopeptidase (penicillin-binding protein 4)